VIILPDDTEYPALLVGEDAQMDLAVLKIDADGLHPAVFGDSRELSVGDSVVAIGNPLTDSLSGTMTNGIISAIDRSVSLNNHPMTLLQTNAALNEGNSGGPLFNMYGQVIGVTNLKMANPYSEVSVEGLGFAIPSLTVKAVTDQLIASGVYVRPGIGITVGAIAAEDAEHYDLPDGLYISSVSPTSDAAAKGVLAGDILTHVNGIAVRRTDDVLAIRDAMQIGDTMTLTIYRDGETFDIEIELFDLSKLY
jgi:serine protease Do